MEKKEITYSTAVKAIITGFVAYGILIGFICIFLCAFIDGIIKSIPNANFKVLSISIPLLEGIALYFIIHQLCRLSTYDVFKKCKTNSDNTQKISKRMNVFFIICLIVLILMSMLFVLIQIYSKAQSIQLTSIQYNQVFSDNFTDKLKNELLSEFYYDQTRLLVGTVILDFSLIISFLTLIPFQKKMINKYNV